MLTNCENGTETIYKINHVIEMVRHQIKSKGEINESSVASLASERSLGHLIDNVFFFLRSQTYSSLSCHRSDI